MKKLIYIGVILFLMISCKDNPYENREYLNGYWEIENVVRADKQAISYPMNTVVEYIELTSENEGFRKKVYPQFDGTYQTAENRTHFKIEKTPEKTLIIYENEGNDWEEELLSVDKNHFSVRNNQGIEYYYQRYEPFNINNL